jgi:hypothetical protein
MVEDNKKPPLPSAKGVSKKLMAGRSKKYTLPLRELPANKKALRHRQKIFTTNNHYEWSK